jgi:hypothetical protein
MYPGFIWFCHLSLNTFLKLHDIKNRLVLSHFDDLAVGRLKLGASSLSGACESVFFRGDQPLADADAA